MQEEDYEVLRNEADAEPRRYSQWDHNRQFRREYEARHNQDLSYQETIERANTERQRNSQSAHPTTSTSLASPLRSSTVQGKETDVPLSRASSSSTSSSSSSVSSASTDREPALQEIRTQRQSQPGLRPTSTARTTSTGVIYRHPTERHPEAIQRIETHRSQHQATVGAAPTHTLSRRATAKSQRPLPSLGAGKPYPPPLPDREEYVVEYDGVDDPLHAQNWSMKRKLFIGAILSFDALAATIGSSIFSPTVEPLSAKASFPFNMLNTEWNVIRAG